MNVIWGDRNASGLLKLVPGYEYRHPRVFAGVHMGTGVWLLILTAILYGYDRGGWWRALLIPAAAGHFYCAYLLYRLPRVTGARRISTALHEEES
jgi:hypothetical protein